MGLRFFMERRRSSGLMCLLPVKRMLPTFTVGPSLMVKLTCTMAGGMVLTSSLDGGELVAVLGFHFAQHGFSVLDAGGVELALLAEPHLLLS